MDDVLVSKTSTESLYFKLTPPDPSLDGRVERKGESYDVSFWGYASKAEINPIMTTDFHKNLWKRAVDDPEWVKKFWTREEPFTSDELGSINEDDNYTASVDPKRRIVTRVSMEKPDKTNPDKKPKTALADALGRSGGEPSVKAVPKPSVSDIDVISDAVGLDPVPQERVTGDVLRGRGPRRGNLEKLLRYWRPIMKKPAGFRRCLVILADHPELYPLQNICAWLHHETTGLWPNEGCHHPTMKNCRRGAKRIASSKFSDQVFEGRMRKLNPKKKDAQSPSTQNNEVAFKALAYMTATGTKVRVKSGLWSSNSRLSRAIESGISYVAPGDMSRIRKPVRSTLYRAATPGGGGGRKPIGEELMFRCPPGFANGGRFTNRRFTTCGPRLFEKPGATDEIVEATRRAAGATSEIARGMTQGALGAKKPKMGKDVTPGDYNVPVAIQRAAEIPPIGKASPRKVGEALIVNASLVYEDKKTPGKLIRRDGSVMDLSTSIDKIATMKNVDDMKDGFLISRVDDPAKMGDAEMPTLNSDLKGFVLALPGDNHMKVSKTPKATPEAVKGANRRFAALKDAENPFEYASALKNAVEDSKGALTLEMHMPSIKNPNQVIQVQRDGATRNVLRWVFQLFLAESAPARNKSSKPWVVVTAENG